MQLLNSYAAKDPAVPWGPEAGELSTAVVERTGCDAFAVGILDVRRPQLDELLAAHGIDASALSQWCRNGAGDDGRLLATAMRKGVVATTAEGHASLATLIGQRQALVLMTPHAIVQQRWWWLLVARAGHPFSQAESLAAQVLIRRWQARFSYSNEPQMSRLLIGQDDRLIAADLDTTEQMIQRTSLVEELLASARPVIQQRYPALPDRVTRDLAVRLGQQPYWVCITRGAAVDAPGAEHWYIELRSLDEDELPIVGVVKDARIALAIAFLHENFQRSPSLADVAQHIHMSPFHFHRLFSKQVGISPKQYLQRKQLQVAKWLLRSTRTPIGTIAERAGFSSHGHFTSTFHRVVGISPSQYRERY